ncbi:MAG: hypothetical protein K0Q49_2496 [Haloplasmataceae bacterium]|jgi:hypothetical protein|nr:hypothetical protein [Haloplasmataceae bacterium]
MNNCFYCGKELTEEGDFCGNCGLIKFYDQEGAGKRLLKQFKYLFTNPVAFIRTSKLVNPIFTGATAIIIILIQLIIIKGMGRKLHLNFEALDTILAILGITVVEAAFMWIIVNGIFKKKVNFMSFLNLTLSIQLISIIINIIGAILGVAITPYLYTIVSTFGAIVSLLLMYQGIKDFVQADLFVYLITIVGSFSGTALVISIVLKSLMRNALRSIF